MGLVADIADVLVGTQCVACENPALGLCATCVATMRPKPRLVRDRPCRVAASGEYDGALRSAIIGWKERGRFTVERPLAHLLAAAVLALDPDPPVVLVPIPSRADRRRARGADVVGDVSKRAARLLRQLGVEITVVPSLAYAKRVRDQAGLSAAARSENVRGSLLVRRTSPGSIVLTDDIVTTGATLGEAVRAFEKRGISVLGAAVMAHRPRT